MNEMEEIGQSFTALLSAALSVARLQMQQVAQRAEEARRRGEEAARAAANKLYADREVAAVQWQRVNLTQWFRQSPNEVAEVWASAATWAEHDPRAREAFDSLNLHLDRLGVHEPLVAQAMREAKDYTGLAELLRQGADQAYGGVRPQPPAPEQATDQAGQPVGPSPEQLRGWERLNPLAGFDTAQQAADAFAQAVVWAPHDPEAAGAAHTLDTALTQRGAEIPTTPETWPAAAKRRNQAVADLLEQGRLNAVAHAVTQNQLPADWAAITDRYQLDPDAELANIYAYLLEAREHYPAYYEALWEAAGEHAPELPRWFAENPHLAYQAHQSIDPPDPAAGPDNVRDSDPSAASAAEAAEQTAAVANGAASTQARPPSIYGKASSAVARLAGLGFTNSTQTAVRASGKHRRPTPSRRARRTAQIAQTEQSRG